MNDEKKHLNEAKFHSTCHTAYVNKEKRAVAKRNLTDCNENVTENGENQRRKLHRGNDIPFFTLEYKMFHMQYQCEKEIRYYRSFCFSG